MIYALSQHFVTSSSKEVYGEVQGPWLQTLSRDAFGNFRQLLWNLTLCPGMAFYLDMGNSTKPTPYSNANENYARELMQLFTIGLYQLNIDGSQQLNPTNNQPIATYDQNTVHQMALAMTGWTYPPPDGSKPTTIVPVCYGIGPMQPLDNYHDMSAKQLVGGTNTPAGQGAVADMNAVIDAVFYHPNVGPFIATRLIRAFVTSNPSTNYIARVATVFNSDTNGVRGNLQAVLTAVLMDPEARNDSPDVTQGHLTSPLLHTFGLMRSLNMPLATNNAIGSVYAAMGEAPLNAPSVFGHYSPLYQLPGTTVDAPEFQIYGPAEMIARANFIYQLLCNADLAAFTSITDPMQLVNAVDRTLLLGRMSPPLRQVLMQAAANTSDPKGRVLTVLYLTAIDPEYAVQN